MGNYHDSPVETMGKEICKDLSKSLVGMLEWVICKSLSNQKMLSAVLLAAVEMGSMHKITQDMQTASDSR